MIARFERPVSAAARWARRLALFALALFVAATLMHRFGSLEVRNFFAICGLASGLAAVALLLGAFGFMHLWISGARGGWAVLTAFVLAAVVLLPVGGAAWLFFSRPEINDVSSDTAQPPQWLVQPEAAAVFAPQTEGSALSDPAAAPPALAGRHYEGGIDRVMRAVRMAIGETGMTVVGETGTHARVPVPTAPPSQTGAGAVIDLGAVRTGRIPIPRDRPSPLIVDTQPAPRIARIQAVHRSMVFGLTSDIMIRLRETEESTSVDMRAASRFGPSDLGGGTVLINRFFDDLDRDLLGIVRN